jgi:hypothetical protein
MSNGYSLRVPTSGFTEFSVFRDVGCESVTIVMGDVNGDSYDMSLQEVQLWLANINCRLADRVVDWSWNYRRVDYDLAEQRMRIPEDQTNPFKVPDIFVSRDPSYGLNQEEHDPFGDPKPFNRFVQ